MRSNFAIERTSDFQPYGELRAKVLNDELDYLTAAVKQVNEEARRSLRLTPTDPAGDPIIPKKADRASRVFAFDADGDPTVSTMTLAEIESLGDVVSQRGRGGDRQNGGGSGGDAGGGQRRGSENGGDNGDRRRHFVGGNGPSAARTFWTFTPKAETLTTN